MPSPSLRSRKPAVQTTTSTSSIVSRVSEAPSDDTRKLAVLAFLSRIAIFLVGNLPRLFVKTFDTSGEIYLGRDGWLNMYVRWDAVYFLHIARSIGDGSGYELEQGHAFLPLLPIIIQYLSPMATALLRCDLLQADLISGLAITNASFIAASVMLYKLTLIVLMNRKLALLSSILFILQPAGIFMSSVYTESPFALLAFIGMYLFETDRPLSASLLFSLAGLTRSNGIVFIGFFWYRLLCAVIAFSQDRRRVSSLIIDAVRTVVYSMISLSGFAAFQYYAYTDYCINTTDVRPWCGNIIPLLYSYVQIEYWNNGFMKYFTLQQLPNFLLAAPMLYIFVCGINSQMKYILQQKPHWIKLVPYTVLWAVLLVYGFFMMHIQVITRFFSSMVPMFWFLALWIMPDSSTVNTTRLKIVMTYFIGYALCTAVTFSSFYPPA